MSVLFTTQNEVNTAENVNTTSHHAGHHVPGHNTEFREATQSQEQLQGVTGTETMPYSNDNPPLHPETGSWEVSRENIIIEKIIGKGAFGQVAQGKASQLRGTEETIKVAIKNAQRYSLFCFKCFELKDTATTATYVK